MLKQIKGAYSDGPPCGLFHKIRVPGTLHKSRFGNADLLIRSCESAFANPSSLIVRIRIREHIFYGIGRLIWISSACFLDIAESPNQRVHCDSPEIRVVLPLAFMVISLGSSTPTPTLPKNLKFTITPSLISLLFEQESSDLMPTRILSFSIQGNREPNKP